KTKSTTGKKIAEPDDTGTSVTDGPDDTAPDDEHIADDEKHHEDPLTLLWRSLAYDDYNHDSRMFRRESAARTLSTVIAKHKVASKYNLLILYDEHQLIRSDADRIYNAIMKFKDNKDILLVLYSSGGQI